MGTLLTSGCGGVTDETRLIRPQSALFGEEDAPLGLDEYQQFTTQTDKNSRAGIEELGFVLLGLFGEVGSLLSELKKKQRDTDAYVAYHDRSLKSSATRCGISPMRLCVQGFSFRRSLIARVRRSRIGTITVARAPRLSDISKPRKRSSRVLYGQNWSSGGSLR